jgi:ParB family chromosome partitioning protein
VTARPDRSGLGRGLAALIPQRTPGGSGALDIPIARIRENPLQPRHQFDQDELESLAASVREHGIIQPILVTETLDGYQLVAGERRLRAARMAGLERIPAVIRQLADREQLELALVENLQRADLNPIETAEAYRQLIADFGFGQDELATRVGRARTTVTNTLRLLDLAPAIQAAVLERRITEGHARALGGLPPDHQPAVLRSVVERELSVRQAEELVRRLRATGPSDPPTRAARPELDPDLERIETELRGALGTKVTLARSRRGGRIVIEYYDDEELGRLFDRLTGGTA